MERTWLFAVALSAALLPSTAHAHGKSEWDKLPARQKGMKIVSAALAHDGKVGGQCKVWVQAVIRAANGGHFDVPLNTADVSEGWQADPTGHVRSLGPRIESAKPGDIVQMIIRDRNGVAIGHTAIVGSNDGGRITWLESNYKGDGRVRTNRTQTIKAFTAALVDGRYTVYRMT